MQLVEQHIINKQHDLFAEVDQLAFASKNLYNYANYVIRQTFIKTGEYDYYAHSFHSRLLFFPSLTRTSYARIFTQL